MKQRILLIMVAVVTLFANATDRFYIEDFTIAPGETRTVSILLENETEYTAFQCDMFLPDKLSVVDDSFALTDRKNSNHTLSVSPFPDGAYRLMSYSLKLKTYSGNSGALVTFEVTASDDFSGPVVIALRNTLFTTETGVEVPFNDEECRALLKGDVNIDGFVNLGDLSALINMLIMGITSPSADVNGDNNANIGDVAALINLLLMAN